MPFLSTPSFDLSAGAEPTLGPRTPPSPAAAAPPPLPAPLTPQQTTPASEAAARWSRPCSSPFSSCSSRPPSPTGFGERSNSERGSLSGRIAFWRIHWIISRTSMFTSEISEKRNTIKCCAYNSAKSKNRFHFWGSHWRHGDALLFSLASAQVMYAFVMRPESLPKSYQDFIQKTGPVVEPVYKAVRDSCRGVNVDLIGLSAYLANKKNSNLINLTKSPPIIPCSVIHPDRASCLAHNVSVTSSTFKKTFPLYFSLTFVPFVVLRLQKFLESPAATCWRALVGAVRSTTFLSAFVTFFQGAICLHRKVATKDHKLVYWFAGLLSGLSILLEKKARRAELALYVLPRAGDSLWYILINRHLLPNIKNAEVALFCMCMGGIMYFLEYEPDTMAPFLRGLIRRFLASKISNPSPPPNPNASYSYLQKLNALEVEQTRTQPGPENGQVSSEKYNLEAIPGL
uniref:Transmembrane protein 135 N-terminal domain-containing protein n=1 Tax=Leersia perrieri TaxID=77586 RepID=A0A0D9WZ11_9ORYZ